VISNILQSESKNRLALFIGSTILLIWAEDLSRIDELIKARNAPLPGRKDRLPIKGKLAYCFKDEAVCIYPGPSL